MSVVYIMRGIPGSGKTELANKIAKDIGFICSTDYFFIEDDGSYNFERNKLPLYHRLNLLFFRIALINKVPIVICDNTNIKKADYEKYIKAAEEFDCEIKIVTIKVGLGSAIKRCKHNVSEKTIRRMLLNWED